MDLEGDLDDLKIPLSKWLPGMYKATLTVKVDPVTHVNTDSDPYLEITDLELIKIAKDMT